MKPLIFVVDDNKDDCLLMSLFLATVGCRSITVSNGHSVLQLARQYQPDLILLDICMPGMDGLEVFRYLQQDVITQSIPVVAVTGIVLESLQEWFLAAGGADYLVKPYTLDKLDHIIHRTLTRQLNYPIS